MMRILIVGCGYVGLPLGVALREAGHEVHGVRRGDGEEMAAAGIVGHAVDVTCREQLNDLPRGFDRVVLSVSSGRGSVEAHREVFVEGTRNILEWLEGEISVVFTSSTGVYGQVDGEEVDENAVTEPAGETGRALLEAEGMVRNAGGIVLRVSGIYGPGRGFLYRQFLNGEATMVGDGGRWLNMVHRDDVVGGLVAALELVKGGGVFNLTDDEPVRERDFFDWLAGALGRELPPAGEARKRKRAMTSKRVMNAKLSGLGWLPRYPTFREGYAELMRTDG